MNRRSYLPAADVFRVLCIGLIAWYHFWQLSWLDPSFSLGSVTVNFQQVVRNGYLLVDMLLVLSGFLLALPYAQWAQGKSSEKPDDIAFYKKRVIRIVPSYLFAIVLVFFAWALPTGQYSCVSDAVWDMAAHLSFTHNLFRRTLYFSNLPGVLWTLGVEAQFYLLFPLIGRAYVQKPLGVCGVMALAGIVFRLCALSFGDLDYVTNQLPLLLDVYAAGMAAAWLYVKAETIHFPRRWPFAVIAALCLCGIFQMMYRQTISGDSVKRMQLMLRLPMALCGAGFLLFGSLGPRQMLRFAGNPVTRFLSGISYNFYIWHQFIARRLVDWNIPAHLAALPNRVYEQPWQNRYSLLVWIAALAAAIPATYLIEKPAAKALRRIW